MPFRLQAGEVTHKQKWKKYLGTGKTAILLCIWVMCSVMLVMKNETVQEMHQISIANGTTKSNKLIQFYSNQ